jgi:hypothetical protein
MFSTLKATGNHLIQMSFILTVKLGDIVLLYELSRKFGLLRIGKKCVCITNKVVLILFIIWTTNHSLPAPSPRQITMTREE